jgi:D-alanyl-D-alanine carboxypeptidase
VASASLTDEQSMGHSRFHHVVFPISLVASVIFPLSNFGLTRGQAQDSTKPVRLKRTAAIRARTLDPRADNSSRSSPFHLAASSNALLSRELNWMLGNKQQKGWYLYEPLIKRLLKTESDLGSEAFATRLSKWQEKVGLTSSGVLDEETLYAMISAWQEERLKDRELATQEQLITAPASDFYHSSRPEELRQVERNSYLAYKRMIKAAVADRSLGLAVDAEGNLVSSEKYLKIVSAFRSREYQESLRRQSPSAGRAGLAINSPHFTGRALDLCVGGDPVETNDSNRFVQVKTRVYQWLVRNAGRFGFRPYFYEPWHWEYVARR